MRSDVVFPSAGLKLAGHLYRPDGVPQGAIVVGHPGGGVKEQAAGLYARRLAERGFVTLTFDAAYQGESEGEPRGLEDPGQRVEDLKAAVSFLGSLDGVDPDRIGVLGICASGGYALAAAATDPRIRAVATVSAVDISRQFRLGADGGQDPAVVRGLLAAAAEARGTGVERFPLFPATEEEARAGGPHVHEGWEYYCTPRARHPRSAKSLTWSSVDRIAGFDAFSSLGLVAPRPVLLIAGRAAVTSWMSVEAYQKAYGDKELVWVEGASHVDLYDRDEYVTPAVEKLSGFFGARSGM
ncbi:alpha/beta hydrolase [Streptomyces sp. MBT62]|uniref:alpha/beta hydrolase n=1 Tax=Streptomyces sp. MBT62 TaxID=2800410 RepID=UPI00190C3732|nr:alpha/beta hydrolase [Streptomyces sp. MBT62]MBK3567724.1 alpha/beta hydrolase [Streptomyces sp. MBT62]